MGAHGLQVNGATAAPLLRRATMVALGRSVEREGVSKFLTVRNLALPWGIAPQRAGRPDCAAERGADGAARRPYQWKGNAEGRTIQMRNAECGLRNVGGGVFRDGYPRSPWWRSAGALSEKGLSNFSL